MKMMTSTTTKISMKITTTSTTITTRTKRARTGSRTALCKARFLKGSPKKYRRVLWQIRGRSYREALMLLEFLPWRTCKPVLKCLQSAAANAQNTYNMDTTSPACTSAAARPTRARTASG
ncbi:unnamed protein product [Prorocentrum cordatum]|uniref:50S ribosomal protein L22, chloroplastic n=1 Tax=Prorocentrum cordatum TaxID=2364126 RepID=A0ABN9W6B7_9DINO|nr:unnamed protein product [Polarella glacialis]